MNKQNNDGNRQNWRPRSKSFRPLVTQWRADTIRLVVFGGALALVAYDAHVSYEGIKKIDLPDHAPLVFAGIIFITQLGVSLLHALGEDFKNIRAGSDTQFIDDAWGWILVIIYGVDIGSNAIEFGVLDQLSSVLATPWESLGGAALLLGFAVSLAFADEVLLRLHDKIAIACQKNGIYAKRYSNRLQAHRKFLASEQSRLDQEADSAGRREGGFEFGEGL